MGADGFLHSQTVHLALNHGSEPLTNIRRVEQIYDGHSKAAQKAVGEFRREFSRALQNIVDLRLGYAQNPRQPPLAYVAIGNPVIYKPDQSPSQHFEGNGLGPGK